jgi:hypothetical protein
MISEPRPREGLVLSFGRPDQPAGATFYPPESLWVSRRGMRGVSVDAISALGR